MSVTIRERIEQLQRAKADVPKILSEVAKEATLAAIEAAKEKTPPPEEAERGVNTVSRQLKGAWGKDSVTTPVTNGREYKTILANNMQYASYVDQGHRMDRHFVPGLYIDPESGLLSADPSGKGGLVVGTKTKYVKGEFMVDAAKEAYERTCEQLLTKRVEALLK